MTPWPFILVGAAACALALCIWVRIIGRALERRARINRRLEVGRWRKP